MHIIHLTPGTGNFHCGSCLRDNALVKAMRRRGHDMIMVPLYLPLVTDDDPASPDLPIFAGGISLFLQQRFGCFRLVPRFIRKFLDSPHRLKNASTKMGMTSAKDLGEMTLGSFSGTTGKQAAEWKHLVDWIKSRPQVDLVSLSNGLLAGLAESVKRDVASPVVCSLQGEDSFLDTLQNPWREQAWDAFRKTGKNVSKFIATSEFYADTMRRRLGVDPARIDVVYNGLDFSHFSPAPAPPARPTVGFLARMCFGKGLKTLVDAFLILVKRGSLADPLLRIAGTKTAADDQFIASLKEQIDQAGAAGSVEFLPNISFDEKIAFLQSLSVLSVPATYGEAFGLYVIEALACGVPVVQPDHGGFPEILKKTGGGILCQPDSPIALADALESLLLDENKRASLAADGRNRTLEFFNADRMAADFEKICESALALERSPSATP